MQSKENQDWTHKFWAEDTQYKIYLAMPMAGTWTSLVYPRFQSAMTS